MKVAIASEGGNVSAHFGHCEGFMIYELGDEGSKEGVFVANPGHQPGFLPVFLAENGVNVIVAGGMGANAQTLFARNQIDVIVGAQGTCESAIAQLVSGTLKSSGALCEEHIHDCG